ncbi:MAG: NHLP family bacteriocin export ABC transporter peptidase/permease/ATPase subunit [Candidatus Muiribacterium halophilum]|uniref:NHLP family bacteriocin export ABC transporter peptidase/permease/ATPase subunit n=1 Tax=Muiribacterium halophilum TaxID=2053465 RepID=A0A2N5ZIX2_MUIH1|nr:MAG: NHLP family bacteriocin export ABC transporter peptidase/permease/ATPase subunit [Candidatus Muirbacterium halophilum]
MTENKEKIQYKRVKTPSVIQMEAVECGAASLAMILAQKKLFITLEELRISCGVSRDGVKASNILKAARKYGLIAKGLRKEPEDLRYIKPPMIIHWNFNHFLVLEGFKKDKVYLNDPISGRKVITYEEFDMSFTGIVMTFEKGEDFKPGGKERSVLNLIKSRMQGLEKAFAFICITGLFLVVPGLLVPAFTRIFIDEVLIGLMNDWFKPLLLGMVITALFRFLLTWLQQHYILRFETKLALVSSAKFFWHILRLPIEFFNQRYAGEISERVQSNDTVANLIGERLTANLVNCFSVLFYVIIMFQYDISLTIVGVSIASINLLILHYISTYRKELSQKMLNDYGKLMGTSMAGLTAIESLKAGGNESDFFSKWSGYHAKCINSEQKMGITDQVLTHVPVFLSSINTAVILSLGGFKVINGVMSVGMLVAFQSLMASFLTPFQNIVALGGEMQNITGDMKRLDDVLDYKIDPIYYESDKIIQKTEDKVKLEGNIELKNISFGYNVLEPPFIKDFNINLTPGSRIALVGGSGSGKSTIAKIISGLNKQWEGDIFFDGINRDKISRELLNNSISVVDQDICMFSGTIRENLTMWNTAITDQAVIQALKDAEIYDIVAARPEGLDAKVSENGANFSGGQRQRLEIARALVCNPTILILDEATSALDPATEQKIDSNIRKRGCACIIVAHRLSTIRDADEIIVLKTGEIVERGNHEQLVEKQGAYYKLIQD